jgi:hypothetical protein
MRITFWRRRHLDERVEEARQEAETSRDLLDRARRGVVEPLSGYARRNSFADIISASLAQGYRREAE